jgi:alkylation response protein AidB-like acyl-CoA dehydrogenase
LGGARDAIGESAKYAAQRKQFGQPIASFGAIKHKLGDMIARTYAGESMLYRTAGMIDERIGGAKDGATAAAVLEEYAVEASILKVAGSETLNFVLDENIQIHGGNGYVRDYPAERHYRDARVNRIFEGTNEINRLLIPGMLARRAVKGDLGIIPAAKALQDELLGPPAMASGDDTPLAEERRTVDAFKKIALMIFGVAMQTYGVKLADEQEVLMAIADILIDVYSADSAVLRAISAKNSARASLHADAARVFLNDAAGRIEITARQTLATMTSGDTLRTMLAGLRRLTKFAPFDAVAIRRRLADEAVARGGYIF